MPLLLPDPGTVTFPTAAAAQVLADRCIETEECGWSYVVEPFGKRFAVTARDDEGIEVGRL